LKKRLGPGCQALIQVEAAIYSACFPARHHTANNT
jgi:hypothetical protein